MKPAFKQASTVFMLGLFLGALLGSVGQRALMHRFMKRGPDPERMLARLSRKLDLAPEQREAVRLALESHKKDLDALRKEGEAKFDAVRVATNADIRKALKPEQAAKFDELTARWEQKRKEHGGPPPMP